MADLHMFEDVRSWLATPELLCEPEDLHAIRKIPRNVTDVGMCLNLDQRDIYQIDHNHREIYEKIYYLLLCWRNKNGPNATWWNLILCLRHLNDAQLLEEVKEQIQEKYAKKICSRARGYEYYMDQDHMAEIYKEEKSKHANDSGIIADLSLSFDSVPSSSVRGSCDFLSEFGSYNGDSDVYTSGDGEFSSGGLTSLHVASFHSCQPSPRSGVSSDSLYSEGTKFYTPHSTMESYDNQDSAVTRRLSEPPEMCAAVNNQDHRDSEHPPQHPVAASRVEPLSPLGEGWLCPRLHGVPCEHEALRRDLTQRNKEAHKAFAENNVDSLQSTASTLRLLNETLQLQHMKELHHRESRKVNALRKKLVKAHSRVFEETQKKKRLQSKVEDCEQHLSCLLDHLRACDERYAEMYRKSRQRVGPSVQAELAALEQEKAALTEELRNLQTKYKEAVDEIQFLHQACAFAVEDRQLEEMKRSRCEHNRVRLECRLAELSARNGELQAQNMRLVEQLTSPTSYAPFAVRREGHQEVVLRGRKCRHSILAQRRCLSDGCGESLPEDCLSFNETDWKPTRRNTEVQRHSKSTSDQFSGLDSSLR